MSEESTKAAVDYADSLQWDYVGVVRITTKEIVTLRAQNQALREALEAVEWAFTTGKIDSCPVCHNWSNTRHKEHCKLGNALKLARGE